MIQEENAAVRSAPRASFFKRHENSTVLFIFLGFVFIVVILQLIIFQGRYPTFISPVNLFNILQQTSAPGIVAVGMTLVMISGGIDLSVGMMASMASIVVALGFVNWHFSIPVSILLGIASAVVLELIMGFIISRTRVEAFIITLGGMILCQGIALLLSNSREVDIGNQLNFLTGNLIAGARDPVTSLPLNLPAYVLIFAVIMLLGGLTLTYTKYGRRLYAIGSNPQAAFLAGINLKNMKLSVYIIMGVLVGISATVLLGRVNTGIITLGQGLEIDTIAMVVIGGTALAGGKGNIVGTLIGVLFMGSIGNAMNLLRLPSEVQYVARGLVIIIAVSAGEVSAKVSEFMARRTQAETARKMTDSDKGGDLAQKRMVE
jgi:ribose/xylose/arabinose/galactoside ABC-type transport system permease subunit